MVVEWLDWAGCYERSWKGIITEASFAHPAKMARGLLARILAHGFDHGYWQRGDLIGEPFGGIFTTGILGASAGLRVLGVELEPRFVTLAQANIDLHRAVWERCGDPVPVIVRGDSRDFARIVGEVCGVVTSPPWCDSLNSKDAVFNAVARPCRTEQVSDYGTTEGQIGTTSGDTYFSAMRTIYTQMFQALRPNGVAAIVVKNFVSKKKVVPLMDQTCALLEAVGFEVMTRVRAWLVEESSGVDLFGEEFIDRKERKSFFRRLAEKKGSPRIDHEEVVWAKAKESSF